jgi:hypothetical protein
MRRLALVPPVLVLLVAASQADALLAPKQFAIDVDLSNAPLSLSDKVQVGDPQWDSAYGIDGPTVLAKHIRFDGVVEVPRGSVAVLLDGDVRLSVYLDWAPPTAVDAKDMRLVVWMTLEVRNLAFRVEPTLNESGPCADGTVPLITLPLNVFDVPVEIVLSTKLCGGMRGVCQGSVSGYVQAHCGVAPSEEGGLPQPVADFRHELNLGADTGAAGDTELHLLNLKVTANVAALGAKLIDASAEASCPYIAARVTEDGSELDFGAKASVVIDCAPVLEMLGVKDQIREASLVERKLSSAVAQ